MRKIEFKRFLSLFFCVMLVAAIAVFAGGCDNNTNSSAPDSSQAQQGDTDAVTELGSGATAFTFTVTGSDGSVKEFLIKTDKTLVGEALMEHDLIAGDDAEYGMYVKTVNGETVEYETDGKYWAFYVNGEYAVSGVDTTEIEANAEYSFKVE